MNTNEELKTRPDFEGMMIGSRKLRIALLENLWTTHVEPLQASVDRKHAVAVDLMVKNEALQSENQKLREALQKIHSMSYYQLHEQDNREGHLPYNLFDEIEQLLKLDKTNP